MRQRVALGFAAVVGYRFVAAGEAYWLEGQESDSLGIVQGELDDSSDLLVVDAVNDGYYRDDFYSGFVQVLDRLQLHVKQVADFAVRVRSIADSVELQIRIAHSGFGGLLGKLQTLGKFNSVGCGLHAVVSNFAGVANGIQEVRRQSWLAAGELYRHL